MSTVDVIVPCYRYARYLRQCVSSVLEQQGPEVRVLIIDDASPDETPEVAGQLVSEDPRVSYIRHAKNVGHIRTYNEGLDWIGSGYYLLLSADDYLLPGALARATSVLDANPGVGFVFGNALEEYEDGRLVAVDPALGECAQVDDAVISGVEFIRKSRATNIVPTPTAIIRSRLQRECGGYRPDLPHAGDMEMWFRLAARGYVGFIAAKQAVYRRHSANMSLGYTEASMLPDLKQRQAVLDLLFRESGHLVPDPSELRDDLMHTLASYAVKYASGALDHGEKALSGQLACYALELSPRVRDAMVWRKFIVKKAIGPRFWGMLRALLSKPSST